MTTEPTEKPFEGWAILELMGHRTRPGYVKEVEMAGGKMMRIDIHISEEVCVTEFYGCSAIYSLRPATEEVVRDAAKNSYGADPRPVRPAAYRERTQIERRDHNTSNDDYEQMEN